MLSQSLNLLLILIIILAAGIVFILRKRTPDGIDGISILAGIITVWITTYLLHVIYPSFIPLNILRSINFLCLTAAASIQLIFAFSYSNRTRWLTPAIFFFLLIEPTLTQLFFWIAPIRSVLFDAKSMIWEQA